MPQILIADHNDMTREMLREAVVHYLGWPCAPASDGIGALQLAEQFIPDAIIVNMSMPGMNGIALLLEIRQHPLLSRTPVIIMSSPEQEEDVRTSACDAYVIKPFQVEELIQQLQRLVPESP